MIFWWILPDGLDWWFHIRCLFEKQYEEHWRLTFLISLHHYAPAQFLWTHSAIFDLIVRPTRRRKRTPTQSWKASDSFRGLQSGWKWFERHTGQLVPWVGSLEFEQIPLWKGLLLGKAPKFHDPKPLDSEEHFKSLSGKPYPPYILHDRRTNFSHHPSNFPPEFPLNPLLFRRWVGYWVRTSGDSKRGEEKFRSAHFAHICSLWLIQNSPSTTNTDENTKMEDASPTFFLVSGILRFQLDPAVTFVGSYLCGRAPYLLRNLFLRIRWGFPARYGKIAKAPCGAADKISCAEIGHMDMKTAKIILKLPVVRMNHSSKRKLWMSSGEKQIIRTVVSKWSAGGDCTWPLTNLISHARSDGYRLVG